jgi:hypothetical protein
LTTGCEKVKNRANQIRVSKRCNGWRDAVVELCDFIMRTLSSFLELGLSSFLADTSSFFLRRNETLSMIEETSNVRKCDASAMLGRKEFYRRCRRNGRESGRVPRQSASAAPQPSTSDAMETITTPLFVLTWLNASVALQRERKGCWQRESNVATDAFLSSLNNDAMRFGPRSSHKTTTTDPSKLARRSCMFIYTFDEINNPARFQ